MEPRSRLPEHQFIQIEQPAVPGGVPGRICGNPVPGTACDESPCREEGVAGDHPALYGRSESGGRGAGGQREIREVPGGDDTAAVRAGGDAGIFGGMGV